MIALLFLLYFVVDPCISPSSIDSLKEPKDSKAKQTKDVAIAERAPGGSFTKLLNTIVVMPEMEARVYAFMLTSRLNHLHNAEKRSLGGLNSDSIYLDEETGIPKIAHSVLHVATEQKIVEDWNSLATKILFKLFDIKNADAIESADYISVDMRSFLKDLTSSKPNGDKLVNHAWFKTKPPLNINDEITAPYLPRLDGGFYINVETDEMFFVRRNIPGDSEALVELANIQEELVKCAALERSTLKMIMTMKRAAREEQKSKLKFTLEEVRKPLRETLPHRLYPDLHAIQIGKPEIESERMLIESETVGNNPNTATKDNRNINENVDDVQIDPATEIQYGLKLRYESELGRMQQIHEKVFELIYDIEHKHADKQTRLNKDRKVFKERFSGVTNVFDDENKLVTKAKDETNFEDHYLKKNILGKGKFAEVFLAEKVNKKQTNSESKVKVSEAKQNEIYAAKFILNKSEMRRAIRNEVAMLMAVNNEYMIQGVDWYLSTSMEEFVVVMELADGSALIDLFKTVPLSDQVYRFYIVQIIKGLEYLHVTGQAGHNDLSPRNVAIFRTGMLKIFDFGFSVHFGNDNVKDTRTGDTLKPEDQEIMNTKLPIAMDVTEEQMSDQAKTFFNFLEVTFEDADPDKLKLKLTSETKLIEYLKNMDWFKMEPPIDWNNIKFNHETTAPYLPNEKEGFKFFLDATNGDKHYVVKRIKGIDGASLSLAQLQDDLQLARLRMKALKKHNSEVLKGDFTKPLENLKKELDAVEIPDENTELQHHRNRMHKQIDFDLKLYRKVIERG
ncbi:protein kinase domain-containing protein [Ditylenchus destructor]|uniref:non-specific serine/threonine protein kinase n=1 Tax=Ditylenchus destructor TaxID=166010 RepID=A0AAD4R3K2_9BILA|nr:protein kinase domain-containing protein [Ditylenchus destructor]